MTANEYQNEALVTWTRDPIPSAPFTYLSLKMNGEAGEVADKVGKLYRDVDGSLSEESLLNLLKELGDVQWYVAVLAHELGFTLEDIMRLNITKIRDRQERGVLKGNGDNR